MTAFASAAAHLVTTGLGPFYDGVSHLALTPEDLLPVIAVGLLAGLRGPAHGRLALLLLPAAWLAGGLAGLAVPGEAGPVAAIVSFLLLGGLLAADAPLPPRWFAVLTAAVGLLHGALNGAAMGEARLGVTGLAGIVATVFVIVTLASAGALVVSMKGAWTRIAVRVAGSWIAAIGLLMIGWWFRGRA
ncbi:MAG: HupE/UreJ family protein [Candidatus Polarisedimenticolia bacterium]